MRLYHHLSFILPTVLTSSLTISSHPPSTASTRKDQSPTIPNTHGSQTFHAHIKHTNTHHIPRRSSHSQPPDPRRLGKSLPVEHHSTAQPTPQHRTPPKMTTALYHMKYQNFM
ncbi:hypothetical protein F5883DRAFT_563613 [Diaporthe sp. PMI_573]|nr:hypothetical protein F5883DRAFT_563613 [Diaporthaceae sp. PMI_573]